MAGALSLGLPGSSWAKGKDLRRANALQTIALPSGFNGVLAYARKGRIEHRRLAGLADLESGRPITDVTSFRWGSVSKWLVSVAVLRLAEQGRVRLDAPVTEYLPAFRRDTGAQVTLRHLLSNRSGLPDLLSRQLSSEPQLRTSTATASEIVARFAGGDLAFVPGEGWDYAALNWVIIAAVMQAVTGEELPTLLRKLVLDPLRMRGAHLVQAGQPDVLSLAAAYDGQSPPRRKMSPVPPFLAASGNVAGTATDAARAAHGIFHGSLLRPGSRRLLTTVNWQAEDYALGGRVRVIGGEPWAWESGKVGGYRTLIAHRLKESETIVLLATGNQEQSLLTQWAEKVILS